MTIWATARLSEVASIRHGGTPSKKERRFWNGDIPWVSPKDMGGFILTDTEDHITAEGVACSATSVMPANSIFLVARSGVLAHSVPVALARRPMAFNQDIKAITVDPARLHADYAFWCLRSQQNRILVQGVKRGATVHSLHSGFIENLSIPLPPLGEQRRIVDILNRANGIVRLRREVLDKTRQLIPALFVDMFGDPATNPRGWPLKQFGEGLREVEFGISAVLSKNAEKKPGKTAVIRIANLTQEGGLNLDDIRYLRVSDQKRRQLILGKGDLLFNWRNSPKWVGKTAIFESDIDAIFASFLYRLRLRPDHLNNRYVWVLLNLLRRRGFFLSKPNFHLR